MKSITIIVIISLFISSCRDKPFQYEIIISDIPANLKKLNSIFDDYNSALPYPAKRMEIYFSSNRNSTGQNFDIIGGCLDISYHEKDQLLDIHVANDYPNYSYKLLPVVNTDKDELGPYFFSSKNQESLLLFASEEVGFFNIKCVYTNNHDWGHWDSENTVYGPYSCTTLNSSSNDLYPTLSEDQTEIYFCSDRDGNNFNIFKSVIPLYIDMVNYFTTDSLIYPIEKVIALSSPYDDKCPFVYNNLMVFVSNRKSGFGGYDLWYSNYNNNIWSEPVNFGDKINTEYDEYRPVVFEALGFKLMIFSSNRPGGKGGFDLYCVKIENMVN